MSGFIKPDVTSIGRFDGQWDRLQLYIGSTGRYSAENCHLFRFAQDTGLTYSPNSYLSAAEIWERLEQWYLDNGTLVYEETSNGKKKAIWADQPRAGDYNIKAVNQVLARFKQLFPKTKLGVIPYPKQKRNVSVLQGITFNLDKSNLGSTECIPIDSSTTPVAIVVNPSNLEKQTSDNDFSELEIEALVVNIRELIALDFDWGTFQQFFAPIHPKLKKEAFNRISIDEYNILMTLKPINDEERKAKELLDIINSNQDVNLRFNQAIASLNQEEKNNLFYYLPKQYRVLLTTK